MGIWTQEQIHRGNKYEDTQRESGHYKPRREAWNNPSLTALQRSHPDDTLVSDFWPLAPCGCGLHLQPSLGNTVWEGRPWFFPFWECFHWSPLRTSVGSMTGPDTTAQDRVKSATPQPKANQSPNGMRFSLPQVPGEYINLLKGEKSIREGILNWLSRFQKTVSLIRKVTELSWIGQWSPTAKIETWELSQL